MDNEKPAKPENTQPPSGQVPDCETTSDEIVHGLRNSEKSFMALEAKLTVLEEEEATFQFENEEEDFERIEQDLRQLSNEQLDARLEVLAEQVAQTEKRIETNRRAFNLGLLKKANRTPRCSHLKSNGQPCRAPAMGNRAFCVFHTRACDTELNKEKIRIGVLENHESLQIALKQIMEHIVGQKIDARDAGLLLRAVQIAGSTLKTDQTQPQPARSKRLRRESNESWGNAVENAG